MADFMMRNFRAVDMPGSIIVEAAGAQQMMLRLVVMPTVSETDPLAVTFNIGAVEPRTVTKKAAKVASQVVVSIDFGDDTADQLALSDESVTHVYATPGEYRVTVTEVSSPETVTVTPVTTSIFIEEPPPVDLVIPEEVDIKNLSAELDPDGDGRLNWIISCEAPGNSSVNIAFGNGEANFDVVDGRVVTQWSWTTGGVKSITATGDVSGSQNIKLDIPALTELGLVITQYTNDQPTTGGRTVKVTVTQALTEDVYYDFGDGVAYSRPVIDPVTLHYYNSTGTFTVTATSGGKSESEVVEVTAPW